MGVTLDYKTVSPVSAGIRSAIQSDLAQFVQSHDWWCEPMWFCDARCKEIELEGWNKLYLSMGYTTRDGKYVDVDFDEDQLMAYRDTCIILEKLASWSREHKLAWEISLAGEPMGAIADGACDRKLRDSIESMRQQLVLKGGLEEKSREISKKYASRWQD
jgi:hypothetical protein